MKKNNIISEVYCKLNLKQKLLVKFFGKDIEEISNLVRRNTLNKMLE